MVPTVSCPHGSKPARTQCACLGMEVSKTNVACDCSFASWKMHVAARSNGTPCCRCRPDRFFPGRRGGDRQWAASKREWQLQTSQARNAARSIPSSRRRNGLERHCARQSKRLGNGPCKMLLLLLMLSLFLSLNQLAFRKSSHGIVEIVRTGTTRITTLSASEKMRFVLRPTGIGNAQA